MEQSASGECGDDMSETRKYERCLFILGRVREPLGWWRIDTLLVTDATLLATATSERRPVPAPLSPVHSPELLARIRRVQECEDAIDMLCHLPLPPETTLGLLAGLIQYCLNRGKEAAVKIVPPSKPEGYTGI